MKPANIWIEAARSGDETVLAALLREAGLPHEDLTPHLACFLVARAEGGEVVGAVGAEVHAPDALLRSLVVAPARRGIGLGNALVSQLELAAAGWGVERWWLLTTTAVSFFRAWGFAVATRESAPASIRRTGQFGGGCCGAAVCLTRERRADAP